MKDRQKKQKDLENLRGALQENSSVFVTAFSKLTVRRISNCARLCAALAECTTS